MSSSTPCIISDAKMRMVKDFGTNSLNKNLLIEFMKTTQRDNKTRWSVHNISNIHLLIGFSGSETYLKAGELSFKELLNESQYEDYIKYEHVILGVMEVNQSKVRPDTYFIDWIDSFVPGYNIASVMMDRYEFIYPSHVLIPRVFIESSIDYWFTKKCWNAYCDADDYKKWLELDFHISEISSEICWDVLYAACDRYRASL